MPPHIFSISDNAYRDMLQGIMLHEEWVDVYRSVFMCVCMLKTLCEITFNHRSREPVDSDHVSSLHIFIQYASYSMPLYSSTNTALSLVHRLNV